MSWQTIVKEKNLSIAEIYFSKITNNLRIEAEFYTTATTSTGLVKGADIIRFSQYGTSKGLNENNIGHPVLRLNEFELSFSGHPAKYCDLLSESEFDSLKLKKNDVLICRTNGNPKYVGKAALVMEASDYAFASYLFRLSTNEKIRSATLVAYLNSRVGRLEIEKYSIVSNQANFSPAKFREITVPLFVKDFEDRIEEIFGRSWSAHKFAQKAYKEAEQLLLEETNLEGDKNTYETISVRNLGDVVAENRFDAEYWQPKFDPLIKKLGENGQRLGSQCKVVKSGAMEYDPNGCFKVLKTKQLKNRFIDNKGSIDKTNKGTEIENGDLLFASMGVGSLGKIDIFYSDLYEGQYVIDSTLFLLKELKGITPECLLTLLRLKPYQELIYRYIVGSSGIISISKDNFENLPIPVISNLVQKNVTDLVREYHLEQAEAERLLEKTKRAVEIYIEKDEKEALKYLET